MEEIKYDKEIQVSYQAYLLLKVHFAGIIAHREDNWKFYIKVWLMEYKGEVERILKKFPCVSGNDAEQILS